MYQWANQNESK